MLSNCFINDASNLKAIPNSKFGLDAAKNLKWRLNRIGISFDSYYIINKKIETYYPINDFYKKIKIWKNKDLISELDNNLMNRFPKERSKIFEEINDGDRYIIAYESGSYFPAFIIINLDFIQVYNRVCVTGKNTAWTRYVYVDPIYRGQNYAELLKKFANNFLKDKNIYDLYSWISTMNIASLKLNNKFNFNIIEYNFYIDIHKKLNRHLCLYKNKHFTNILQSYYLK